MTNQKKLEVIEEAFNYYHDRNSLTSKDEKELLNLVNELYAAISVTRCCTELKDKEAPSFRDWLMVNCEPTRNTNLFKKGNKLLLNTELLEMYKKEYSL